MNAIYIMDIHHDLKIVIELLDRNNVYWRAVSSTGLFLEINSSKRNRGALLLLTGFIYRRLDLIHETRCNINSNHVLQAYLICYMLPIFISLLYFYNWINFTIIFTTELIFHKTIIRARMPTEIIFFSIKLFSIKLLFTCLSCLLASDYYDLSKKDVYEYISILLNCLSI